MKKHTQAFAEPAVCIQWLWNLLWPAKTEVFLCYRESTLMRVVNRCTGVLLCYHESTFSVVNHNTLRVDCVVCFMCCQCSRRQEQQPLQPQHNSNNNNNTTSRGNNNNKSQNNNNTSSSNNGKNNSNNTPTTATTTTAKQNAEVYSKFGPEASTKCARSLPEVLPKFVRSLGRQICQFIYGRQI